MVNPDSLERTDLSPVQSCLVFAIVAVVIFDPATVFIVVGSQVNRTIIAVLSRQSVSFRLTVEPSSVLQCGRYPSRP